MVVNQDHYVNDVFHKPGPHELTVDRFDTPYVVVAVRTLVDVSDPADVAAANAIQDSLRIEATSARPFEPTDYDHYRSTRPARSCWVAARAGSTRGACSDDVRMSTRRSTWWGRLRDGAAYPSPRPATSAATLALPVGEYRLTLKDVPVDAFWSISVYNKDGYFEPNDRNAYNINSVMAQKNDDGSITVHFGGCGDGRVNCLPIMEGWNYAVRLYRPRAEVLDGSYVFPTPQLID